MIGDIYIWEKTPTNTISAIMQMTQLIFIYTNRSYRKEVERPLKHPKNGEYMKKIASVISTTILIIMIAAALFVAVPKLFGIKMYSVLSGSMEPVLSIGDLIYVVPANPENIKEGDVISFVLNEDLLVATHRVAAVDTENMRFTTKGDANSAEDAGTVLFGNVIGIEKFSLPKVGYLFSAINTTVGRIISITIIIMLAIVSFVLSDDKKKPASKDSTNPADPTDPADPLKEKDLSEAST